MTDWPPWLARGDSVALSQLARCRTGVLVVLALGDPHCDDSCRPNPDVPARPDEAPAVPLPGDAPAARGDGMPSHSAVAVSMLSVDRAYRRASACTGNMSSVEER